MSIYTSLCNFSKDTLPAKQCKVCKFMIDEDYLKSGIKFEMASGINIGSTKEDVIKAFGEPTQTIDSTSLITLEYRVDTYVKASFTLKKDTSKVYKIELQNVNDKSTTSTTSSNSNSNDVPSDLPAYTQPTSLSDDLFKFNVEIEGALYNLPAPISEFKKKMDGKY